MRTRKIAEALVERRSIDTMPRSRGAILGTRSIEMERMPRVIGATAPPRTFGTLAL
jgi:hypothetical protein